MLFTNVLYRLYLFVIDISILTGTNTYLTFILIVLYRFAFCEKHYINLLVLTLKTMPIQAILFHGLKTSLVSRFVFKKLLHRRLFMNLSQKFYSFCLNNVLQNSLIFNENIDNLKNLQGFRRFHFFEIQAYLTCICIENIQFTL